MPIKSVPNQPPSAGRLCLRALNSATLGEHVGDIFTVKNPKNCLKARSLKFSSLVQTNSSKHSILNIDRLKDIRTDHSAAADTTHCGHREPVVAVVVDIGHWDYAQKTFADYIGSLKPSSDSPRSFPVEDTKIVLAQ